MKTAHHDTPPATTPRPDTYTPTGSPTLPPRQDSLGHLHQWNKPKSGPQARQPLTVQTALPPRPPSPGSTPSSGTASPVFSEASPLSSVNSASSEASSTGASAFERALASLDERLG